MKSDEDLDVAMQEMHESMDAFHEDLWLAVGGLLAVAAVVWMVSAWL